MQGVKSLVRQLILQSVILKILILTREGGLRCIASQLIVDVADRCRSPFVPLFRFPAIPLSRCPVEPLFRYSAIPLHRYSVVPLFR